MAASIAIEEDSGTGTAAIPEHNGYYAGCFSHPEPSIPAASTNAAARHDGCIPAGGLPEVGHRDEWVSCPAV